MKQQNPSNLSTRLLELRIQCKLTQEEVAKKVHIVRQTYSAYETSRRIPNLSMLERLAPALNTTVQDLVDHMMPPATNEVAATLSKEDTSKDLSTGIGDTDQVYKANIPYEDAIEILEYYKNADPENQKRIKEMLKLFSNKSPDKE